MTRFASLLVFGGAGLLFSPLTASAQYGYGTPSRGYGFNYGPGLNYGYGYNYNGPSILPPLNSLPQLPPLNLLPTLPSLNPYAQPPRYNLQYTTNVTNPYTGATFASRSYYTGITPPAWSYPTYYPQSGAYMSGQTSGQSNLAYQMQQDLSRAQRAVASAGGSGAVGEKPVVAGVIEPVGAPGVGGKVLAPADRAKVLSGEALNDLLREIAKAETKVGARASAYLPVSLLDEVRFGGPDAADAVNLARRAGSLNFPVAFNDPALKDLRAALDRDFTAVAVALQAGKVPEAAKRTQFEATLKKVETALVPVVKALPRDDADAARRFMTQLSNAMKALKAGAGNGLIDPKWSSEGTAVADLVKHMTRHKLLFAAAPEGNEETYTTLHRNLGIYLFLLTQPKK